MSCDHKWGKDHIINSTLHYIMILIFRDERIILLCI